MIWLHFVPWHWLLWLSLPFALVAFGWYFAAATTMALLKRIPLSAWALIAVIVGGSLYHVAAVAAAADGAAKAQAALSAKQINDLSVAVDGLRSKLADVSAQAETDKQVSKEKMEMAAKLVNQLGQEAVQAETDKAAALAALELARKLSNCATTASMKLCPAMRDY